MKPRLTATSVIRSPRYYSHFFWLPGKNRHTFSCKKKTWLLRPNFFGPLVTVFMGFHCNYIWCYSSSRRNDTWSNNCTFFWKKESNLFFVYYLALSINCKSDCNFSNRLACVWIVENKNQRKARITREYTQVKTGKKKAISHWHVKSFFSLPHTNHLKIS